MQDYIRQFMQLGDGTAVQVSVVLVLAMVAHVVVVTALHHMKRGLEVTRTHWDDMLFAAAMAPLIGFIWVMALTWVADILATYYDIDLLQGVAKVRNGLVIVLISWFLLRFFKSGEEHLEADPNYDEATVLAVGRLLRAIVVIVSLLLILQSAGFSVQGVLAFGGVGGIAVGFAARDLLANFFGGLMIFLDRPFRVGDWIRSPDRDIEGTVEKIGWRLTCIRNFSKRPLYVPNSLFATIAVENPSRMLNRRILENVGIRYADAAAVEAIVTDIKAMLMAHEGIDTDSTLIVNFNAFAPSSLEIYIYAYTRTIDWVTYHGVKQDVLLSIYRIIEAHGAEIAFPTSTVHLASTPDSGDGAETDKQ